jgi:hypothetical protein
MKLELTRAIYVHSSHELIKQQLQEWGRKASFQLKSDDHDCLVLERGSRLKAMYTFNIQRVPTTLEIKLNGTLPCQLTVQLCCQSLLTIETPGDKKKLALELNMLEDELWQLNDEADNPVIGLEANDGSAGRCGNHPERRAEITCERCGQFLCHSCRGLEKHCISCARKLRKSA